MTDMQTPEPHEQAPVAPDASTDAGMPAETPAHAAAPSGGVGSVGLPTPVARPAAPGRGRGRIILVVIGIAVILGGILYATRNNQAANDLTVGSCFDVPNGDTISTVERHDCTDSHDAEVFDVATYTGTETSYPSVDTFDTFAQTACEPVFQSYVGVDYESSDLDVGYFYPSSDSWSSGDRTVTCYASPSDGSKLSKSIKGSGATSS